MPKIVMVCEQLFYIAIQSRSEEFVMKGCCGGLGANPQQPEANGSGGTYQWVQAYLQMQLTNRGPEAKPRLPEAGSLGAKPPAARGKGVWGRSPQRSAIFTIF